MSESNFHKTWYTVPNHIRKLPGMTLALLDFYETIFELWNNGKKCFLSNPMIKKRTGIKSSSTIQEAFEYFEKQGVMKRVWKGGSRFIEQTFSIQADENDIDDPVDNPAKDSIKNDQHLAVPRAPSRCTESPPLAVPRYKNNKININKLREREPLSGFEPDEKNINLCLDFKLNLKEEIDSFINRCKWKKDQYNFSRWMKLSYEYRTKKTMDDSSGKKSYNEPYSAVNRMNEFVSEKNIIRN